MTSSQQNKVKANSEKTRHLENTIYDSKTQVNRDCKFSTLFQSHLQTEYRILFEDDFEIKSKIYSLNLRLVSESYISQDALSFRNLFFALLINIIHYTCIAIEVQ
jgi:hypothetical protein